MKETGSGIISRATESLVKPIISATIATTRVEKNSDREGMLCKKGFLPVLIMCIINTWDTVPNTNHPHWNTGAISMLFAPIAHHKTI